ncbi:MULTISPECIES: hypothetical protein [Lacticaseibacillus]|nr:MULTISPECIES: hypothetical protein [Lacticaseibacillus]
MFYAVPNSAISGQMVLERGGHDFEPQQNWLSLKDRVRPAWASTRG